MRKALLSVVTLLASSAAFAEEAVTTATTTTAAAGPSNSVYFAFAAAIAIAFAALGGAIGQGLVGSAAMEGIGRNPNAKDKMQTPMILGLVFIETVVLFGFVIAFVIYGKIG